MSGASSGFRGASEDNTIEFVRFVRERLGGSIWVYPAYVGQLRTEKEPDHAATVALALMAVAMGLGTVCRAGGSGVLFKASVEAASKGAPDWYHPSWKGHELDTLYTDENGDYMVDASMPRESQMEVVRFCRERERRAGRA